MAIEPAEQGSTDSSDSHSGNWQGINFSIPVDEYETQNTCLGQISQFLTGSSCWKFDKFCHFWKLDTDRMQQTIIVHDVMSQQWSHNCV